mmetsp:Transcript_23408/g.41407  ORF Transcript_23408/g.41407 Transcript_23408/m.41407 type:complete len:373 (-) Transcript_23408:124-1242(-)
MDLAADAQAFANAMWSSTASSAEFAAAAESGLYPTLREVAIGAPLAAAVIWTVKTITQLALFGPLCKYMLKIKPQTLIFESDKLETIYKKHKPGVPDINEIKSLSKALDRSVEDLNQWFRVRQVMDRDVVKVRVGAETMWRLCMYGLCLALNLSIMRNQPWAKDIARCWEKLPFQPQELHVRWFFVYLEIPLYIVLFVCQITDGRKAKDMWEMTAHHSLVVVLMTLCYLGNFMRIGMIGLAMHDVTDLFLESSKLANMFRFKGTADLLFTGFGASWAYFRLYKFLSVVLFSVKEHGSVVFGQVSQVFMLLLAVLLGLNLFWFYKIATMLYRILWAGSPKERRQRDQTDLSTDDDVDSDSSYLSDAEVYRHED